MLKLIFIFICSFFIFLYNIPSIQSRQTCQLNNAGSAFADFDGNFSANACIVISEFSAPDCDLAPPDYTVNATIDPCPGIPLVIAPVIDGGQIFYATMEDAIANCPYGLIQFVGTIYMSDIVSGYDFWYNQSIDLTIQGFPQVVVFGNQTVIINSALVGFKNLQVKNSTIQVTLKDAYIEGCGSNDSIFLTRTPCPTCVDIESAICPGAWFRRNDTILDAEFCQQTAAWFNGTQHISFQNHTSLTDDHYNGFWGSDSAYFQYTDNITLEAWINPHPDVDHYREMIAGNRRRSDATDYSFGYGFYYENRNDGGYLRWGVKNPGHNEHYCRTPIPTGIWTHVAGTFSQGVVSLYINGQNICNDTANYKTLAYRSISDTNVNGDKGVRPFTIGAGWYDKGNDSDRNDYMGWFQGLIDEVRLWTVVRNPLQVSSTMQTILSPLTSDLVIYMRFDSNFGFHANWAAAVTGQPTPQFFNDEPLTSPDIWAVPDCFCQSELGSCTPSVGARTIPYEAVTSITVSDSILNYEFIVGMLIDPNGDFGQLWLPGKTSTSGPIYNQVVRFVPGAYMNFTDPYSLNTSYQFVPGVNLALLPPFYYVDENPYLIFDFFLPGWFLNDGLPPFMGSNFFPGIFVPANESTVPLPSDWEPGDLIFQPGYYFFFNNSWQPFEITNPQYVVPIILNEGIAFNPLLDLDNCTNPGLTVSDTSVSTPVIETILGCTVSPTDIEPTYLDPTKRDPCFVLRDIRSQFPTGTENIDPEFLLGCQVGPDDIEPTWLDPLNRNPCFALRDIRAAIPVNETCPSGLPPIPPTYMPCLKNNNLTLSGVTIQNYNAEKVVCQWACDANVQLTIINSTFAGTPGYAVWGSGLNGYKVYESSFCPCGGATEACVYLNGNHIADGDFWMYNVRHCAVNDILPISCSYPITQTLYCNQSQVYCLDVFATLSSGCPQVEVSPGVLLFDSDCATYGPCTCGDSVQLVELPDGSFVNITTNVGDIVIPIEFATPSVKAFGNTDPNFISFPCDTEDTNITVTYPCLVDVNETVVIDNVTIIVPTQVTENCTAVVTVQTASSQAITCPCPRGYNISADTILTGIDAYNQLGLYQTCQWDIPGGLPGEQCLDGVVQCPYLGGTLGSGDPPPAPLYVCDPSTGTAKFACSDCVAGQIMFEGYVHNCPASCTAPNTTVTIFEDVCHCLDFYLTFNCTRFNCFNATSCPVNDTLCAYYGVFTWDSVGYACYVDVNATDCIGVSYAPNYPVFPVPNGTIAIPCTDTYLTPSPGPCTCSPDIVSGNNVSIPCSDGSNCTNATMDGVYSDPTLQILCQPSGTLSCRCDGIQAINPFSNSSNLTFVTNSSAIWIDNVPLTAGSWYMQNVVTQQAPIGVRVTRFPDDNIWNFPILVPHFWSGHFVIAELQRINTWVTGTVFDWVLGYDHQWNVRNCSYIYPATPDNNCKQYRPTEADSCVVDSTYDATQTPDFNILRFDKVKKAINNCPRQNIIIHKSVNAYEERIKTDRSNLWIGSYDNAVIVGEGHVFTGDNITIRGITFIHTGTSHTPLILPGTANDDYLSALFDDDEISNPPNEFRLYNNYFNGHSVNDAGVMVGLFGKNIDVSYNLFDGWYTRTIYVSTPFSKFILNTFRKCPGRAFFANKVKGIKFEENQCIDCSGMKVTKYMETFSIRAYGDIGKVHRNALGQLIFQNFTEADFNTAFDVETALAELDHDIGCNSTFDSNRVCTYHGNKHMTLDLVNTPSHSIVCHALRGGAWHIDNVTDNECNFARIGFLFAYTPLINYLNRTQVSHKNFLVQPMLTLPSSFTNGADQAYTSVGSLVSLGCSMPDCVADGVWPPLEVNPRCAPSITPNYGFSCMSNVTAAVQYGKVLNLIEVTSERARLRRDNLVFGRDAFVVGINDPFCCERPVIYGSSHLFATDIQVMENIEMRLELAPLTGEEEEDATGDLWMYTPQAFLAGQIRFLNMFFNGRNIIGSSVIHIGYFFFDPATSIFQLQDCVIDNWWHLPDDTVRGVYTSVKGDVDVVILPTEELIFYEKRLPGIEGFSLFFKTYTTSTKRHVKKSKKNPLPDQDSMAIIVNNTFTNLDGNSIWLEFPGNWEFDNNTFIDCGNRRPLATEVVMLTGNMESTGSYYCRNNFWNTSKILLWAYGGANTKGDGTRKSALTIQDLLFPFDFKVTNNTVVLNSPYDIEAYSLKSASKTIYPPGDYGWFKKLGPKFLGGGASYQSKDVKPFNDTADKILQRSTDPKDLTGGGGTITEGIAYVELADTINYMALENQIEIKEITIPYAGYPVAGRFNVPPPVAYKTLNADTLNLTYLFLQEPGLLPLMLIAIANNKNTAKDYLAAGYNLPSNSPGGFEGLNADLVSCYGYKDYMESTLQQCNTCNDGCPIQLPPACLIDPKNASFVPENPYYNTWYFVSLTTAMQYCANPKREIWMYAQDEPYTEQFVLDSANWTIRSKGEPQASVLVSSPIIFIADSVTLDGFIFLHNMGNVLPTAISTGSPDFITIRNCTFYGSGTTKSAVTGTYTSLALINNTFLEYDDSDHVLWLFSECGTLILQLNKFYNVRQYSVYASNYNIFNGYKNVFNNCGGDADAVVYFSICHNTSTSVIWSRNKQYRDGYIPDSSLMRRAAYWLDGVPINNRTFQHIDLTENKAKGLDIGIRATNTDDISNSFNHRATVFFYAVSSNNIDAEGNWHYTVWSPIPGTINDLMITNNPSATEKYWCDADCEAGNGLEAGLLAIGIILAFVVGWIVLVAWFCLNNPISSQIEFSHLLGRNVAPNNPALDSAIDPRKNKYYRQGDLIFANGQ